MLRRLAATSLVLAAIACGPAPSADEAAAELSAPATDAGRVAFLPPLGEAPPADADWNVSPSVRIEALPPAAPAVAAVFLSGTPSAPARTGNHWLVQWRTGETARAGVTYRIRVLDGAAELGAVDVLVVAPGGRVRDGVRTAVLGRTVPVKFTIAAGAGEERPWLERVSVSSSGAEGNGSSSAAAISADGRFVAFSSEASTLAAADGNGVRDVFVHDRATRETSRVSVAADGAELGGWSAMAAISGDGRRVAFVSSAPELCGCETGVLTVAVRDRASGTTILASARSDGTPNGRDAAHPSLSGDGRFVAFSTPDLLVVPEDGNWYEDVFVRDLETGEVRIASLREDGGPADGACAEASLSRDGRRVAFASSATNLVPGDGNGQFDVFVKDLGTGAIVRASAGPGGEEANGQSRTPRLSADGRFVAFQSLASNLAPGDSNGTWDVFVHDLATGVTVLASARPDGAAGSGASTRATISADGRLVAFQSAAEDLVAGDGNGAADAFVRDLVTGTTFRASVDALGVEAAGEATSPAVAADGSAVAFASDAATLVPDDGNGARDVFVRRLR